MDTVDLTSEQKFQLELEQSRMATSKEHAAQQTRLEAVRLAKDTLSENRRSAPADAPDITAEDILSFAEKLTAYVHG